MTVPFHEVQFPPGISYGARGGPGFNTTVLMLASGQERRNQNWSRSRGQWDVAHGVKTEEQFAEILKFFYARRGKAFGFRFKDWSDYQLPFPGETRPTLMTTNGSTNTVQIVKVYGDGAATYTRTIYKPVSGSISLYNNGVLTTDYSVSYTTGVITLGATLAATTGRAITISCEFDVPVRFDTDQMQASIDELDSFTWGQIPLIELRL